MTTVHLDPNKIEDYRTFCKIKRLPSWSIRGRVATFPDEYASRLGLAAEPPRFCNWQPSGFCFDYQRAIVDTALQKQKYAIFADCGLGKTIMFLEYVQGAMTQLNHRNKGALIVSPLMVVRQTLDEAEKFYPGIEIEQVDAAHLNEWMRTCHGKIGITNYDAIKPELGQGELGCLILDESSMLKSHYGKWGTKLIELGRGLDWKLCCSGTPAPNDRIEYANHAVILDHFPTVNSFLATYFVNRGQTQERWALKDHALEQFYRSLSHWCIFLVNPATYGWQDQCATIPPIKVHIHEVPMSAEQSAASRDLTGCLFVANTGGIVSRSKLGQIAKGRYNGNDIETAKPAFIRDLVGQWSDTESTLIWCIYNDEQDKVSAMFPDAASISGSTKFEDRQRAINEFKSGERKTLISKPKILGFGLNLQIATRQVFSGLQDSYESYYQAVKRSNRIGSTKPLNVHIPITDVEEPMVQNVLRKADMVQHDTEAQERIFKSCLN